MEFESRQVRRAWEREQAKMNANDKYPRTVDRTITEEDAKALREQMKEWRKN